MKNFTAVYLQCLKRKLLDDYGNPIQTIRYSEEKNDVFYIPPYLEYDIMEIKKQLKTPILRETKDLNELKGEGILLCSLPVTSAKKFYKQQADFLFLCRSGQIPFGAATITSIAGNTRKSQHKFIFDDANRRVKLIGPNSGPFGEGPWIHLEEN